MQKPTNPLPTVLLAFDFGTQKMGVAVGQRITGTGTPLPELAAKDGQPDWKVVAQLIDDWQPDAFLVGIPLNEDGTENDMSKRARKFGKRLYGRFGKPCHEINEYLSSFEARETIRQHSGRPVGADRKIDSVAAVLILESWFNKMTDNP